jgi:hypothetical protein
MINELGLPPIPGGIFPFQELRSRDYHHWAHSLGPALAVQLPDIVQGGGRGTFFVRSHRQYGDLRERLSSATWRGIPLKSVSIHRLLDVTPASMALCLTRSGPLLSGLQRQLIDLPYCADLPEDGVFCGHAWGDSPFSAPVAEAAGHQARRMAAYLAERGYKGILGIDFLVDEKAGKAYPLEINPRFTGAFPMLSLLHIQNGLIPMEAFHILQFLDCPYDTDLEGMNAEYARMQRGSHLLLFLPPGREAVKTDTLNPGLYRLDPQNRTCHHVGEATSYREIRDEAHFILVDGPPDRGGAPLIPSDPLQRLCRLLFSHPVADHEGALSAPARLAVNWVYDQVSG